MSDDLTQWAAAASVVSAAVAVMVACASLWQARTSARLARIAEREFRISRLPLLALDWAPGVDDNGVVRLYGFIRTATDTPMVLHRVHTSTATPVLGEHFTLTPRSTTEPQVLLERGQQHRVRVDLGRVEHLDLAPSAEGTPFALARLEAIVSVAGLEDTTQTWDSMSGVYAEGNNITARLIMRPTPRLAERLSMASRLSRLHERWQECKREMGLDD